LSAINIVFSEEDKSLIKVQQKRLTDEFREKSWTNHGVNKLLKKLQDTGTVDRRPGSRRLCSASAEENVETINDLVLSQRGQAADPRDCP